jgi:hypothetical protein
MISWPLVVHLWVLFSLGAEAPTVPQTACVEIARVPTNELHSQSPPWGLSFWPNTSLVALTARLGEYPDVRDTVKIYDTKVGKWIEPTIPLGSTETLTGVTFAPNGAFLAAFIEQPRMRRALRVYSAPEIRECFAVSTEGYSLGPVTFSDDGKKMVRPAPREGRRPFSYVILDPHTGIEQRRLTIDEDVLQFGAVGEMGFTPDAEYVYAHQDDRVLVWATSSGNLIINWQWSGTGAIAELGCTPDSKIIRALIQEGSVASFDVRDPGNAKIARLDVPPVPPNEPRMIPFERSWSFRRAAFTSNGASVLRDAGGKIEMYDLDTGKMVRLFTLPPGAVTAELTRMRNNICPVYIRSALGYAISLVRLPE